jgi:uncharacterized delta-60 repeat protein
MRLGLRLGLACFVVAGMASVASCVGSDPESATTVPDGGGNNTPDVVTPANDAGDASDATTRAACEGVAPGALDPTFGDKGVAIVPAGAGATGPALIRPFGIDFTSAGAVVVAASDKDGKLRIARLDSTGHADTTFGGAGTGVSVVTDPGDASAGSPFLYGEGSAARVAGDDSIFLAGTRYVGSTEQDMFIAHLTSAGALDATFGAAGIDVVRFGAKTEAWALAHEDAQDRYVASATVQAGPNQIGLAKITPTGAPVAAFGDAGTTTSAVPDGTIARSVAVAKNAGIVVGGFRAVSTDGGTEQRVFLARFTTQGQLDPTFNVVGWMDLGHPIESTSIARQAPIAIHAPSDGSTAPSIVIAASFGPLGAQRPLVARISDDGKLVKIFDTLPSSYADVFLRAVAIQPDGKIVVGGGVNQAQASSFLLARYKVDGTLDPSFGTGGVVTLAPLVSHELLAIGLARPDGRIVITGCATSAVEDCRQGPSFVVARVCP